MWARDKQQQGFTIVELLIVIVVIGILAAMVIVAYNGVQQRAQTSATVSSLKQAANKMAIWQNDNSNLYPAALSDVGISDTGGVFFQYVVDNNASPATYCLTGTYSSITYYISSSTSAPQQGVCSGYNLLAWNKAQSLNSPPVPSATVDATTYRTSIASMRIGPNAPAQLLRGNPYTGTPGQVYTVTFWMRTDATWNGTINNSKVRFGDAVSGVPLVVCQYAGPKASWVQVTCSYTMNSTYPQINISVGNDGTIGNIWIDDFSLSRT